MKQIGKAVGRGFQTIFRYEHARGTDAFYLQSLLELAPEIDPGWLLTGEGQMLRPTAKEIEQAADIDGLRRRVERIEHILFIEIDGMQARERIKEKNRRRREDVRRLAEGRG